MIRRAIVFAALLVGCLLAAQAQTSSKERVEAFVKLPDWSGLWEWDVYVGEGVGQILSQEGLRKAKVYMAAMHPTFTPAWQPKYDQAKKAFDDAVAADPNQPPGFATCGVAPFPATMLPGFYQWRVTPEETTLISSQGAVRHIYTDGRPHPPADELWPTTEGNSIGHWHGDTLVVDTISIRNPSIFLAVEPFEFPDTTGPLSDELHALERIRMVNHDEMQIQFTVEDPVALAKPINMTITHERVRDFDRMEDTRNADCDAATDRNPVVNGRFTTIVKPAPATQTKESLVGTWRLVSYKAANEKGEMTEWYGPHPVGFLTLTADGRMSVIMADPRRKPLDPSKSTSDTELANALNTFFGCAGTYSFAGGQLSVHIEVSSDQIFVNTNQVRSVTLQGDRLTLRGRFAVNGELVWERLKPETSDK